MEKIYIEQGKAMPSTNEKEVVIALSPAFGSDSFKTIMGMDAIKMVREICAGIEEEGMEYRIIKVFDSTDLALIASKGSSLAGSGICVGLQTRGTTVIHQKDLVPLDNLELFPQSPFYDEAIYRRIGKNAARYAKKELPEPIEIINDYMVMAKFMVKSTLLHFRECDAVDENKPAMDVKIPNLFN